MTALITCCVVVATRALGQRASVDSTVQWTTLDNGLQVIVAEDHSDPLVTVLVAVRTGAMTQDAGDQGLAHLYEHLLFRSYKGNREAFGVEASELDAMPQGTTAEEVVTYYLALPSEKALKAIALLARLVQTARFNAYDLNEERPIVLDELHRNESDPELELERQASRLLWGASWGRKDYSGDSTTLRGITLARLQETYARYYIPNNAALVVTGDVPAADVFTAARDRLGSWTRGPDPFAGHPIPPVLPLQGSAALLMAKPVAHATILVEFQGPSAGEDSIAPYAVDLLCDILNEESSPFQQHLTEFQSVACEYEPLAHVGPITFRGVTMPERAASALTALLHELDELASLEGVTDEAFAIAKKRQRVTRALSLESSYALAPDLALWWSIGSPEAYQRYEQRVAARRLVDLQDVAMRFVSAQPRVIAVLAPPEVVPGLQTALRPAASVIERVP